MEEEQQQIETEIALPSRVVKAIKVAWFILSIPIILVLSLLAISGAEEFYRINIKYRDYITTTATLDNYTECKQVNEYDYCKGVYLVNIDGVEKTIISSYSMNKKDLNDSINIKYNDNNPDDYIELPLGSNPLMTVLLSVATIILIIISIVKGRISLSDLIKKSR